MATLTLDPNNYTTIIGWMGNCDENCEPFNLNDHTDKIEVSE